MLQRTSTQKTLLLVGSLGPLGHLPASGTVTVGVIGIPLFWVMHGWSPVLYVLAAVVFAIAAVFIHDAGDRILGEKDSRRLVWDELAGFMFAVALVPWSWQLALVGFFVERVLDILKVPPARWVEDHVPGGWGVVGDDIVAGLYTCGILHLLIRFAPTTFGVQY